MVTLVKMKPYDPKFEWTLDPEDEEIVSHLESLKRMIRDGKFERAISRGPSQITFFERFDVYIYQGVNWKHSLVSSYGHAGALWSVAHYCALGVSDQPQDTPFSTLRCDRLFKTNTEDGGQGDAISHLLDWLPRSDGVKRLQHKFAFLPCARRTLLLTRQERGSQFQEGTGEG